MRRPSPWLSRVQLGSRRDGHTKAISAATNSHLENWTFVLFTSQIECIIYIQRSVPSLSEDFRSVFVGRLHCRHEKKEKRRRNLSKMMLKGQSCDNATSPAHAGKQSRGRSWAVLREIGIFETFLLSLSYTVRAETWSTLEGKPKQRGQWKQRAVKGGRVWQPQRGWPPLLSEKMTLISQSLFWTREEAKRTKMTAEPKNSLCCRDTCE